MQIPDKTWESLEGWQHLRSRAPSHNQKRRTTQVAFRLEQRWWLRHLRPVRVLLASEWEIAKAVFLHAHVVAGVGKARWPASTGEIREFLRDINLSRVNMPLVSVSVKCFKRNFWQWHRQTAGIFSLSPYFGWMLENCRVPRKWGEVQVLGTTKCLVNTELESNANTALMFVNYLMGTLIEKRKFLKIKIQSF